MTVLQAQARIAEIRGLLGRSGPATTAPPSDAFDAVLRSSLPSDEAASATSLTSAASGASPTSAVSAVPAVSPVHAASAEATRVASSVLRPASLSSGVPYASLFQQAATRHGVSPTLLAAVAKVESGYNPAAVSRAGAQGLMQLMPGTARGLGVDALDPAQAVDGAARLLSGHLRRFGSLDLALAAYNAGGGAVSRYGGIPPFEETQAYVPKVKAAMAQLAARGFA
ncbi:lytic transglycosylase domain-containing protein [Dactylosporangium sucinum]|uniref:Transglycosylase SLT domain-containing protein n=1 Tax=Dactylosporangium sucinum TaxID=1424081 RepID=A0A917U7N7_9ACTN|nr:lytic transglycosylase domain-containing protein [Dactylosporangium sucinum]GGM61012.1 hypothetical protein GCM10007977_073230 [Dactylosporangium sucinum]